METPEKPSILSAIPWDLHDLPPNAWFAAIFAQSALFVTYAPEDPDADDRMIRGAFEAFRRARPGAPVGHVALCLHVAHRRCRGVTVACGAAPAPDGGQVAQALQAANRLCFATCGSPDQPSLIVEPSERKEEGLLAVVHLLGMRPAALDTAGAIRLAS
jgi:hypothetical protein